MVAFERFSCLEIPSLIVVPRHTQVSTTNLEYKVEMGIAQRLFPKVYEEIDECVYDVENEVQLEVILGSRTSYLLNQSVIEPCIQLHKPFQVTCLF